MEIHALHVLKSCFFQFISGDVLGICSRVFCDFGESFEVLDPTGEEPKELFIQNISQVNTSDRIAQIPVTFTW